MKTRHPKDGQGTCQAKNKPALTFPPASLRSEAALHWRCVAAEPADKSPPGTQPQPTPPLKDELPDVLSVMLSLDGRLLSPDDLPADTGWRCAAIALWNRVPDPKQTSDAGGRCLATSVPEEAFEMLSRTSGAPLLRVILCPILRPDLPRSQTLSVDRERHLLPSIGCELESLESLESGHEAKLAVAVFRRLIRE